MFCIIRCFGFYILPVVFAADIYYDTLLSLNETWLAASNDNLDQQLANTSCPDDMVLQDSTCIKVSDCTRPVLFERQCLERCPEGYRYFVIATESRNSYTKEDINNKPCLKLAYFNLLLFTVVFGTVVYTVLLWMFFSTKRFSLASCTSTIAQCLRRRLRRRGDEELLINPEDD